MIVQPLLERRADAEPIFGPMAAATAALLDRYSDDELFAECGVETAFFDALSGSPVPGVTASAQSDEFTLTRGGAPATTELFDVEASEQEFLAAVVVTVDADHVDDIESFVDAVGSDEFATCYARLGVGGASPDRISSVAARAVTRRSGLRPPGPP